MDLSNFNTANDDVEIISKCDKYSRYAIYFDNLSDAETSAILEIGLISDSVDKLHLIDALKYFMTILEKDERYTSYGPRSAYEHFMNSTYLDTTNCKQKIEIVNPAVVRALYDTPSFINQRDSEHFALTAEIAKEALYQLKDDPENKDVLSALKTLTNLANENKEMLENKRDIVTVRIPSEEFYNSYVMLAEGVNEMYPGYKRVNPGGAQDILRRLDEDSFFKNERVSKCLSLSNLSDT